MLLELLKHCYHKYVFQPPHFQFTRPKDPSELVIEDEEIARDYAMMYNKFTEMEETVRRLSLRPED